MADPRVTTYRMLYAGGGRFASASFPPTSVTIFPARLGWRVSVKAEIFHPTSTWHRTERGARQRADAEIGELARDGYVIERIAEAIDDRVRASYDTGKADAYGERMGSPADGDA